jgi:hypothetical protein
MSGGRELTEMFSVRTAIVLGFLLIGAIGAAGFAYNSEHSDDKLYDELVTIRGKAVILNHPQLGKTDGGGLPLIFQREDCKRCLVATRTNLDGSYEITVARGRYRVILRETRGGGSPSYDLLAPSQPRYIEATSQLQPNVFDLQVVLPAN